MKTRDTILKILEVLREKLDGGRLKGVLKIDNYDYDVHIVEGTVSFYVLFNEGKHYTGFTLDTKEVDELGEDPEKMSKTLDTFAQQIQKLIIEQLKEGEE